MAQSPSERREAGEVAVAPGRCLGVGGPTTRAAATRVRRGIVRRVMPRLHAHGPLQLAAAVAAAAAFASCGASPGAGDAALPPAFVASPDAGVDAASGWPRRIVHRATGIALVLVPAGEFTLGSPPDEPARLPAEAQRRHRLAAPFYLGVTEVTQSQWRAALASAPSHHAGDDLPVDRVSWHDAQRFCAAAGGGLRLPREVEWEYACRAGTTTAFAFGATLPVELANFHVAETPVDAPSSPPAARRGQPVRAGSLPANAWGLHEMHGNVWEWCADTYTPDADAASLATAPPAADVSGPRIVRGGSWALGASFCRSAFRGWYEATYANRTLGLRVAWTPAR